MQPWDHQYQQLRPSGAGSDLIDPDSAIRVVFVVDEPEERKELAHDFCSSDYPVTGASGVTFTPTAGAAIHGI